MDSDDMHGRVCVITGASNGIGKEAAVELARRGATVVMVARSPGRGDIAATEVRARSGSDAVDLLVADLASLAEVRRLAGEIRERYPAVQVLVNNAGAYNTRRTLTPDGYETTFAVNHLAHFLLTDLLLDTLTKSAPARIINVSSGAHLRATLDLDDIHGERSFAGFRAYGQSKLANVLFTYQLARRLGDGRITVNAMHPGVVRTGFGRNNRGIVGGFFALAHVVARPAFISPTRGAETVVYLASSSDVDGVTGKYFVKKRPVPSSPLSYDETLARRLWDLSERLVADATAA